MTIIPISSDVCHCHYTPIFFMIGLLYASLGYHWEEQRFSLDLLKPTRSGGNQLGREAWIR